MTIETKYNIGDTVWYSTIIDDKLKINVSIIGRILITVQAESIDVGYVLKDRLGYNEKNLYTTHHSLYNALAADYEDKARALRRKAEGVGIMQE